MVGGGGKIKLAFCGDTETAVTTQHAIEPELSHSVNESEQQTPTKSLNFLITVTVLARRLAHTLQHTLKSSSISQLTGT